MAVETILTSQTPGTNDPTGANNQSLGWKWKTSASGKQVVSGRVWIPSTGKPTGMRWQLWQYPSTLLQDILLDSHSGSASSWMNVDGITPQNITADTFYIVNEFIPGGGGGTYPYSDSGGPITVGTITATAIYHDNATTSSTPPQFEGFTSGVFFADIGLDDPASGLDLAQITETGTVNSLTLTSNIDLAQIAETGTVNSLVLNSELPLAQIVESGTVNALDLASLIPLDQITETGTVNSLTLTSNLPLDQIVEEGTVWPLTLTGGAEPVAGGWLPKIGRHCTYLEQKTYDGNTNYVKRRPAIITAIVSGDTVDLRVGRSGEVHTGVDRKTDPTSADVGVYVSY